MSSTAIRRGVFKGFWDKHSESPSNQSMMLNQHADEGLEESDRRDILACLPDITNMDAVDIGAGIGRFTTVLADTARYVSLPTLPDTKGENDYFIVTIERANDHSMVTVLSTDFIESFIEKNQERNAHKGNVAYQIGDACSLNLDESSVDLVFTNWLMMYLNDTEVISFLHNALRWLRPTGHLHLRESCSEPSTARATGTVHVPSESNPTSYRFSSVYIRLFDSIHFRDENDQSWRFETLWACSVPTYIVKMHNWRQVHWLLRKVKVEDGDNEADETKKNKTEHDDQEELLNNFGKRWVNEQKSMDQIASQRPISWPNQILEPVFKQYSHSVPKNSTVFVYSPRHSGFHVNINLHLLAERLTCNVWSVETDPMAYRTVLTSANEQQDQRVRVTWTRTLTAAIDYWMERGGAFDVFVGLELLATTTGTAQMQQLKGILAKEAMVVLLESFERKDTVTESFVTQHVNSLGFTNISVQDVTENALGAMKEEYMAGDETGSSSSFPDSMSTGKQWFLIRAKL